MKKKILLALLAVALAASTCSLCSCMKGKDNSTNTNTVGESPVTDGNGAEASNPEKGPNPNMAKYRYDTFDYWLCTPDVPNEDLPLIVYLHDSSDGGSGIDGMIQKDGLTKSLYENNLHVNAYVLIPNLSGAGSSWYDARSKLQELISYVTTANGTDASKVYLTGVGKGATGVYEIAMAMPNAFAAFAPIGGNAPRITDVERLKDVKLLAYVNVDIEDADAASVMDFMFELGKINTRVEIFVLENYDRSNYVQLYSDMEQNLLQTLISH